MNDNEIKEYVESFQPLELERKPLIETGREKLYLKKLPNNLDFSKTIGNTIYTVKSHFDQNASECIFRKIIRMTFHNED